MKLHWIKWYPVQWLHSTARDEMTVEQRATFHDFVCLAAVSQTPGQFKFVNIESLARQLNTPPPIIKNTLQECLRKNRVTLRKNIEGYVCKIVKWHIYQPLTESETVNIKSKKSSLKLTLREEKRREEKKKKPPVSKFIKNQLKLAEFLERKIKEKLPRYRFQGKRYKENWANTFRIMIDKKEATEDEIKRLIIWIFDESDFWYKNILSADKLRKQFGRLWAESGLQREEEEQKKYNEWLKKR